MKKLIIGSLLAITMTISASAEFLDYKKEIGIGVSSYSFENYWADGTGMHINLQLMGKLNDKIALGLQLGYSGTDTILNHWSGDFATEFNTIEILPTITFIMNNKFDISAMIGYSSGTFTVHNTTYSPEYSGMSYGLGLSYALTKNLRLKAEFLQTDGEDDDDDIYTMTRNTIGISLKF